MLLSPVAVGTVSEILDASDFYRESHAKMYWAALALWSKGEPVDAITLANELEERAELEAAGGQGRVAELARARPGGVERRALRGGDGDVSAPGLIRAGQEIVRLGQERDAGGVGGEVADSSIAPSRSSSSSASSARRATSRTSRCC